MRTNCASVRSTRPSTGCGSRRSTLTQSAFLPSATARCATDLARRTDQSCSASTGLTNLVRTRRPRQSSRTRSARMGPHANPAWRQLHSRSASRLALSESCRPPPGRARAPGGARLRPRLGETVSAQGNRVRMTILSILVDTNPLQVDKPGRRRSILDRAAVTTSPSRSCDRERGDTSTPIPVNSSMALPNFLVTHFGRGPPSASRLSAPRIRTEVADDV